MKKGSTFNILKKASSSNKVEITGDLLKQVQGTLLQMLKDFAAVCDRNGFYYSLCGGSALGAVRHQGFIPWDDDVDVFMLRKDYNKFLEIFDKELGDKYIINAPSINPEIGVPVTQIMKKDTIFRTYNNPTGDRCGIYIDLFVLENAPDNAILRKLHGLGSLFWGYGLSCSRFNRMRDDLLKVYADAGDEVTNAIKSKARNAAGTRLLVTAHEGEIGTAINNGTVVSIDNYGMAFSPYTDVNLPALYNVYNAAGALAALSELGIRTDNVIRALGEFRCGFGRMEQFDIGGGTRLMLVKNPAGCNQVLEFLQGVTEEYILVICLNDRGADGTDVSWIWDADFERLPELLPNLQHIIVSGDRAADMHVRIKYAGIDESMISEERNYETLVSKLSESKIPVFIMPTYTALLDLRTVIVRHTGGSEFWE